MASDWRLTIRLTPKAGRGLFATRDLREGEAVVHDSAALVFIRQDFLGLRDLFRRMPLAKCLEPGTMVTAVAEALASGAYAVPEIMGVDTVLLMGFLFGRAVVSVPRPSGLGGGSYVVPAAVPSTMEPTVPVSVLQARVEEIARRLLSKDSDARAEVAVDAARIVLALVRVPPPGTKKKTLSLHKFADREWFLESIVRPYAIVVNNCCHDGLERVRAGGLPPLPAFLSAVAAVANHSCMHTNVISYCTGPLRPVGDSDADGAPDPDPDPYLRWGTCVMQTTAPVPRGGQLLARYAPACDVGRWGITCPRGCSGQPPRLSAPSSRLLEEIETGARGAARDVHGWLSPMWDAVPGRDEVLDALAAEAEK